MSRKLIAFDFDGTLVESHAGYSAALQEFSEARGLPWDALKMGKGYIDPLKYDLGWGVSLEEQPPIFEDMNDFYFHEQNVHGRFMPTLFEQVQETLGILDEVYDMAIVTARERKSLKMVLDHYGIGRFFPHFRTFCCARERGYEIKPAPDALQCVIKDTKHAPQDVVVIGDTSSDIRMAIAAGSKSIVALWGVQPGLDLWEHNPTLALERFAHLPDGVKTIFSR